LTIAWQGPLSEDGATTSSLFNGRPSVLENAMATISLRKLDGSGVALERAIIDAALGGKVVHRDSAQYDDVRTIWNAMIDRRPAVIVCAASEADVVKVVNFARAHNLAITAKGGGHNIAGKALVDGGLVVDFQQMKRVDVDPKRRTARIQPGATLGDVDRATQRYGLLVPTGVNSTTGIAGLTLGGGFGWTTRAASCRQPARRTVDAGET
jgi:FAD/FMN-containing dehydrogenase